MISPYRRLRENAREVIGANRFIEVCVKASLETCEKRDPKRLYAGAKRGEIEDTTGVQDLYEEPTSYDITIDSESNGQGKVCRYAHPNASNYGGYLPVKSISVIV